MCLENLAIFSSNGSREIYSSETIGCGIFDLFVNFDNCQPEVVSDDISGVVEDPTGVKVRENLVILGQTVVEIYDCLSLLRTTTTTQADGPYGNGVLLKNLSLFCYDLYGLFDYLGLPGSSIFNFVHGYSFLNSYFYSCWLMQVLNSTKSTQFVGLRLSICHTIFLTRKHHANPLTIFDAFAATMSSQRL